MSLRWLPWSWIVRHAARSFGFFDPALFLARLRKFGQPSEYDVPLEIVRNAVMFHSRGLINTRAIQNNLDWVWPYWIERQFDPRDVSFLPRSANFSHINLTHRNWTAVGLPDLAVYPLVDPRGLVIPLFDGWSIDAWVVANESHALVPSRLMQVEQRLETGVQAVETVSAVEGLRLFARVELVLEREHPVLQLSYRAEAEYDAHLVVAIRPYNVEGIQFVDTIQPLPDDRGWLVNGRQEVRFAGKPSRVTHSNYAEGDVFHRLSKARSGVASCPVGMATAAACFAVRKGGATPVGVSLPLAAEAKKQHGPMWKATTWTQARAGLAQLAVPDVRFQNVYEAAVNSLLHLSAEKIYPGPYTYRRFWYRDASLMLEALLQLGAIERARGHLDLFARLQRRDGYFESQEGEWDSNGEVLWAFGRFGEVTGETFPAPWVAAIEKGARWLDKKRLPQDGRPQSGLLPAGFSAEHFGPNDYYYWDDFWAVGGLRAVAPALRRSGATETAGFCEKLADSFFESIERSLASLGDDRGKQGPIPASPFRRMDSGAIGVLVADYPLQLYPAGERRLLKTAAHFVQHNFLDGGFFQDMTHSGVNIYLTLAIAQTFLRAGDERWQPIVRYVLKEASGTGQWPEAIHPMTGGGCIGDGQHGWAAAEWFRWTRNAFVREEGDEVILGSGLLPEWLDGRQPLSFGPTRTKWGAVSVAYAFTEDGGWVADVQANWRTTPPRVVTALGKIRRVTETAPNGRERVQREALV